MKSKKIKTMSKSTTMLSKPTKGHHVKPSSQLDFHYFLLNAVPNGSGGVSISFSQIEAVPDGMVIKNIYLLKRNGGPFPIQGPYGTDGLISIGEVLDFQDAEIPPQTLTDVPPVPGTYTYDVSGNYGDPNDSLSSLNLGSNWFTVTV